MENLFSYGTLQLVRVQLETFGRTIPGFPDRLVGYRKETIKIKVESIVNLSGIEEHTIISFTGNDSDIIDGVVLSLSEDELRHADDYEAEDYKRVEVTLKSGRKSWVYIKDDSK